MKTTSFVLAVGLALFGCSKKSEDASPADRCSTAINKAVDSMVGKSKDSGAPPQMIEIANKLRGIMIERCKADAWPDAVISCFAAATDQPGIKACRTQLPPEQAQRMQTEIIKVMSGAGRPGGMRGGPGPDGQGPHGPMGGPSGPAAATDSAGGGGSAPPAGGAAPAGSAAP